MKSGVRIYGVDSVDHMWLACCALHNWLLEVDGLSETWVGGMQNLTSNRDGEMGSLEFDGVRVEVPNALARLSRNLDPRNYDSSGMGPGLVVVEETRNCMNQDLSLSEEVITREMELGDDPVQHVRHLLLVVFRQLLVNYFAILFSQNKIVWPSRRRMKRRRVLTEN